MSQTYQKKNISVDSIDQKVLQFILEKFTDNGTYSSELDLQENNCISENSQLLITPISKNYNKTRPCSKKDWDEQQDRYKKGEQMMWDDSKHNKSKKGDVIAIWKYKKGVSFHHIEKVENTQSRSKSWSQNVGQTDRNVIFLSPEFSYFKWDKWIDMGGHKRCMGTSHITTSKDKILNELKKILNGLKDEQKNEQKDKILNELKNIFNGLKEDKKEKYILYKTDILRRIDDYKIEFSEIGKDDISGIIKKAKEKKCPIISQTGPSSRYPTGGKWYLKGKGMNYNKLKNDIDIAYENNKFPTVKLYLIKLDV
jgi:hypothetical protein